MRNPHYFEDLARTRFCLAPTGGGHGHRQILVAFSGCTPLLIGELTACSCTIRWQQGHDYSITHRCLRASACTPSMLPACQGSIMAY